ncbi:Methyl-accepting chemotaxis protein (MCP) signaling domain protein [compost metagenome]
MQHQALRVATAIATSQRKADVSLEHTREARAALEGIVAQTGTFSQISRQVASVTEEPLCVTHDMYLTIDALAHIAKENTCAAKQTLLAAADIGDQMQHLESLVGQFRLPGH